MKFKNKVKKQVVLSLARQAVENAIENKDKYRVQWSFFGDLTNDHWNKVGIVKQ